MMYFIVAYNYPTLFRAIRYTEDVFGLENSRIVYRNTVTDIPKSIVEKYKIDMIYCCPNIKNKIRDLFDERKMVKAYQKKIRNAVKQSKGELTLVIFKDMWQYEASCIDYYSKLKLKEHHIWLIEEGSGIYSVKDSPIYSKRKIKTLIYTLMGLSIYPLEGKPQGMDRRIEKIICAHPALLKEKFADRDVCIEQQIDVFDEEHSKKFIDMFTGSKIKKKKYDFAFLTMPVEELYGSMGKPKMSYDEFLHQVFEILSSYGTVVIKPHPRDNYDYSKFVNDKIEIFDIQIKGMPFECLVAYLGFPRLLTLMSSVCNNSCGKEDSIYLYRTWGLNEPSLEINEEFCRENRIINCNSFDELRQLVSN